LRSEFASDCLPEEIKQLTLSGFQENTEAAIDKYFEYYKINSTDADLPIGLLVHPLTLRMYCEVTNPKRERVVGVEAMPGSLAILFEKHLEMVATKVAEQSPSRQRVIPDEVRSALTTIGGLLWSKSTRSIGVTELRKELGDDRRD
jgi:hypothetical protein